MSLKNLLLSGAAAMVIACGGASQGPDTATGSSGSELSAPGESLDPAAEEGAGEEGSSDEAEAGDESGEATEEADESPSDESAGDDEGYDDSGDDSGDDGSYEEDE